MERTAGEGRGQVEETYLRSWTGGLGCCCPRSCSPSCWVSAREGTSACRVRPYAGSPRGRVGCMSLAEQDPHRPDLLRMVQGGLTVRGGRSRIRKMGQEEKRLEEKFTVRRVVLSDHSVTSMAISVGGIISSILNVKYPSAMFYVWCSDCSITTKIEVQI